MATIIGIMCIIVIILMVMFGISEKGRTREGYSGFFSSDEDYVATYDGGIITKEEFAVYYYLYGDYFMEYNDNNEIDAIEGLLFKEVEDEMLYSKAIKSNVTLTQEQIDYLDMFEKEVKSYVEEIGLDITTVKDIYERDYYIQNYIDKEVESYTDEDVLEYLKTEYGDEVDLNEYDVQIIYYDSEQSARTMLQNLKEGANFDDMVKFSEDEESAENNGMMKCYDDGQFNDEFISAIKVLEVGKMYDGVLELNGGYCVVKLVSKVENGRVKNTIDKEDLFYAIFESELDMSESYYYEEVAREVIDSLGL